MTARPGSDGALTPRVVRRWATGADVRQVAEFTGPDGAPCVLVLAGATLQAWRWDGTRLWSDATSAATRVLHVRGDTGLVLSGERLVRRLDLRTGAETWRDETPDGTNLSGPGSSKLALVGGRRLWFTAPAYATAVTCRELLPGGAVETRWVHDFGGHYDAGFGPVLVVADVLGLGAPQLLLSTRTGSGYGTGDDVSSERLVLGREDGRLLQLVLSVPTGATLAETAYRPDPGDYPCARPYGLLTTAPAPGGRIVVMVSCQVEEYYAVTRVRDGALSRAWGRFVEKDWPHDEQELRPQVTSVVERPGENPWLVTGHHDGTTWTTVIDDAVTGARVAALPGHYLWGVTGALAVVSPATSRPLTGREPTLAVRLADLGVVATHPGHPVVCGDDELPAEVSFHAERRSLVSLGGGLLTRLPSGEAAWWDPASGASASLGVSDVAGAFPGIDGAVVLVGGDGALRRVGADHAVAVGAVRPAGRRAAAFAVAHGAEPVVLLDGPRESLAIRADDTELPLPGRAVAAAREPSGAVVVACLEDDGVVCWRLRYDSGGGDSERAGRVVTRGKPTHAVFLDEAGLLLVAERTGVHTAAVGVYRLDGTPLWQDLAQGPHPNLPAVARTPAGRWLAAYDDHGQLTVRDAHSGEVLAKDDWTAAYTTPVRIEEPPGWLRVGGIHGVDAVDEQGRVRWRHGAPLWTYFPGEAALAGSVVGCMTRGGRLDAFDVADGRVVWRVELGPVAARPPLVALGSATFVAGTAAGSLIAVDVASGAAGELLAGLGAAVETLLADGSRLLAGTADGVVREVALG
ncbi:outer membrane protein assembly factor BamB family protein [Jiangella endophytica]|uniref:outer membrane protein assembly factor BamB family protein n=1 Tax=Jiangella endophytica TaxID=1623398 RepID=UPI000E341723|nr:PQQ-binding-like beta-propeller repeat protein [Jiangella endophytica]